MRFIGRSPLGFRSLSLVRRSLVAAPRAVKRGARFPAMLPGMAQRDRDLDA